MSQTKRSKPKCMRMNLRSRKDIAAYLLDVPHGTSTYIDHESGDWLFAWDTGASSADMSFDNLLELYQSPGHDGGEASKDKIWIEHCRRKWAEEFQKWDPDVEDAEEDFPSELEDNPPKLYEWASEDTAAYFIGRRGEGKPDDDCWNMLYDGTHVNVEFRFGGQMGDDLVLTEFGDYRCDEDLKCRLEIDTKDLKPHYETNRFYSRKEYAYGLNQQVQRDYDREDEGPLSWKELKRMYEYVQTLDDFFDNDNYRKELEYQAAFTFFVNICNDLPNPTAERMGADYRERRRQDFLSKMLGSHNRVIDRLGNKTGTGLIVPSSPRKLIRGLNVLKVG
jgi:hypothetical protein